MGARPVRVPCYRKTIDRELRRQVPRCGSVITPAVVIVVGLKSSMITFIILQTFVRIIIIIGIFSVA